MPLLARNARPLLTIVQGKPHASADDHEEGSTRTMSKEEEDAMIMADPMSSDDEAQSPPPPPPPSQSSQTPKSSMGSKRGGAKGAQRAGTRRSTREVKMQVPRAGSFQAGRAHRGRLGQEDEKENWRGSPSSSAEKREADTGFNFGMEHQAPKRQRAAASTVHTTNIHARVPAAGKKKTFGRGAQQRSSVWDRPPSTNTGDDDDKEVDMLDAALDSVMESLGVDGTNAETLQPAPSPVKPARPNLLTSLAAYKKPATPNLDPNASGTSTPLSSPAHSSSSGESLQKLEEYVADLPEEDAADSTCALCQSAVDPAHSAAFWCSKERTVRNQTLFCKEHRRRSAQAEYTAKGLPSIDWGALPGRIRTLHGELAKILRNERGSKYRDQHAAKLVSGKAAALPSRRKDKAAAASELQDAPAMSCATGYYGPRGRRVMMDAITSELSDVIRQVSVADPVVGRSGFAAFVQAVLVPELTVMLVMQDLGGVSEGVAEEVVQESGELGLLLNEEVDDEVGAGSEDEEEGEQEGEWKEGWGE